MLNHVAVRNLALLKWFELRAIVFTVATNGISLSNFSGNKIQLT